jgi:hypothetical protein
LASIIAPEADLKKHAEKMIDEYLWHPAKRNKIQKLTLKRSKEQGGIAYPDISSKVLAFRLMLLVRRLASQQEASWHKAFDYFFEKVKDVSIRQLKDIKVPRLYKDIRVAVLTCKFSFLDGIGVGIDTKTYHLKHVKTKLLYKHILDKKTCKATVAIQDYWKEKLGNDNIDFGAYWKLNTTRHVDGLARSIHYALLYKALYTRSRISNFADIDANCKFCSTVLGEDHREDCFHVFVKCQRVQEFWNRTGEFIQKLDPGAVMNDENKIFGFSKVKNKRTRMIVNMVLQSAQRTVWFARADFEEKDETVDLWESLRERLRDLTK